MCGGIYRKSSKDYFTDGHEREDVRNYRHNVYGPKARYIESREKVWIKVPLDCLKEMTPEDANDIAKETIDCAGPENIDDTIEIIDGITYVKIHVDFLSDDDKMVGLMEKQMCETLVHPNNKNCQFGHTSCCKCNSADWIYRFGQDESVVHRFMFN